MVLLFCILRFIGSTRSLQLAELAPRPLTTLELIVDVTASVICLLAAAAFRHLQERLIFSLMTLQAIVAVVARNVWSDSPLWANADRIGRPVLWALAMILAATLVFSKAEENQDHDSSRSNEPD